MADALTVRSLVVEDLDAVARVHLAAFPSSALTQLGRAAVWRYYEWQLLGPHDVTALGAFDRDVLAGFCFGGVFRGALAGFLRRNRGFLIWRVATRPWLLGNSIVRDRLRVARRSIRKRWRAAPATADGGPAAPPSFGILSIGVEPSYQGRGVGKVLMAAAETAAERSGFNLMTLTVDPSNTSGIRFYTGLQWRKLQRGTRWTGAMQKVPGAGEAMQS